MAAIETLDAPTAREHRADLIELLCNAVADGASVGFLHPFPATDAIAYWNEVIEDVASARRLLLVARDPIQIVGTAQLVLPRQPNATHRAEVETLLVHTSARRQGLGTALVQAAEDAALDRNRHLIILETRAGDPAGRLYESLGYVRAGVIPGYCRSSSGRLQGTALYYRDLRDGDGHVLGETDVPARVRV